MHKLKFATLLLPVVALPCCLGAENYAVLFSGGGNLSNNWDRYYTQTFRMWSVLTTQMGYSAGNVHVLFADGTDPSLDQKKRIHMRM